MKTKRRRQKIKSCIIDVMSLLWVMILILGSSISYSQTEDLMGRDLLRGKTGVAGRASIDSSFLNPAQAAFLTNNEVQLSWGYQTINYIQRYPGFAARDRSSQGMNPPLPIPTFAWKIKPSLTLTGLIVPFPVKQDIAVRELPLVVFGQQNEVDISGRGALNGYLQIIVGYQINRGSSFGLDLNYYSIKADGAITPSGGSGQLAEFSVFHQVLGLNIGYKRRVKSWVVGTSTTLFQGTSMVQDFSSQVEVGSDQSSGKSASVSQDFINPIRIGIAYYWGSSYVTTELKYVRRQPQKRFSLVNFKEKPLDNYDTLSAYFGFESSVKKQWRVLGGFFYEPSDIGPGDPDSEGKSGFGFLDLALNLGQPPTKPAFGVALGGEYFFSRGTKKRLSSSKKNTFYPMSLTMGLAYIETSIGVDEGGEQPGAYLARRYVVPIQFSYKF